MTGNVNANITVSASTWQDVVNNDDVMDVGNKVF